MAVPIPIKDGGAMGGGLEKGGIRGRGRNGGGKGGARTQLPSHPNPSGIHSHPIRNHSNPPSIPFRIQPNQAIPHPIPTGPKYQGGIRDPGWGGVGMRDGGRDRGGDWNGIPVSLGMGYPFQGMGGGNPIPSQKGSGYGGGNPFHPYPVSHSPSFPINPPSFPPSMMGGDGE